MESVDATVYLHEPHPNRVFREFFTPGSWRLDPDPIRLGGQALAGPTEHHARWHDIFHVAVSEMGCRGGNTTPVTRCAIGRWSETPCCRAYMKAAMLLRNMDTRAHTRWIVGA